MDSVRRLTVDELIEDLQSISETGYGEEVIYVSSMGIDDVHVEGVHLDPSASKPVKMHISWRRDALD